MAGLSAEAREVLQGFADEVSVLATQVSGARARKAQELAERIRAFDGTKAAAKDLLTEGDSDPTE